MKPFYKIKWLLLALLLAGASVAHAQPVRKVSGIVRDTANNVLEEAGIELVTGKDTLRTRTNAGGKFSVRAKMGEAFALKIVAMGYATHTSAHTFKASEKEIDMGNILLKPLTNMLEEVVIKAKPLPVRYLQDTVEYDAGAYNLLEGSSVSDLLKQLQGIEVDEDDNVTAMGKEMVKLRVNGKDFFTNNVKDFISRLPAGIVSKIQVVDDWGDLANFTGIKTGEPQKMLNIVTKPGMNRGTFGNVALNSGTNDQYGANASANLWRDEKQINFGGNFNQAETGSGVSAGNSGNGSYRDKFGKISASMNYSLNNNRNANEQVSSIETVNALGILNDLSTNRTTSSGHSQTINLGLQSTMKKFYLNASVFANFGHGEGNNFGSSAKTGVIRQDFDNASLSSYRRPNVYSNFSLSRRFENQSSLSFNGGYSSGSGNTRSEINSQTRYYDQVTGMLQKDSLLNRILDQESTSSSLNLTFSYGMALSKPKDTVRRNLSFSYGFSLSNNFGNSITHVTDPFGVSRYVDSLSNTNLLETYNNRVGVNYAYNAKHLTFGLGISGQYMLQKGDYDNGLVVIDNSTFTYAPTANINYRVNQNRNIGFSYNGNSLPPALSQLQPVRNLQNLQNVVIGNPDLKPAFQHGFNFNTNKTNPATGRSLMLSAGATVVQRQIVTNTLLVQDTLNSLKQETRYVNVNGMYNLNGGYNYSIPFAKRKYVISIRGSLGYGNRISFTDNVKYANSGINLSQGVNAGINTKKFNLSTNLSYAYNTNNFTLLRGESRAEQNWAFGTNSTYKFWNGASASLSVNKRINTGYVLNNNNPWLINASFSKSFLKSRMLQFKLTASDLLNQQQALTRYITGNAVVDTRTNVISRIVSASLSINLSKFGGQGTEKTYNIY